jgi:DNA repair protein RadC
VTEVELIYRNKMPPSSRPSVKASDQAYDLLLKSWDMNKIELQEQFRVMLLDRKKSCIGISTIATGGISNCLVDLKLVFATALKASASSIIIAHNHPSGNVTPSEEDKTLTARFAQAGRILELPVIDHLIVTREGYTSLADEGLLFSTT